MRTISLGGLSRMLVAGLLAATATIAAAQPAIAPGALTGTLLQVRTTGAITIGYRESSIPFSYLSARGEPIGYSIDLCKLLVEAMSEELGRPISIHWQPVTAESRIDAVSSGKVDLECGSTTNNLARRKQVSFSPTIFVSGTKLLVPKDSPVKSFRDLGGLRVAVTRGTTNETTLREVASKFGLDLELILVDDHAAGFALLTDRQVAAFATDEVLLHGLVAHYGVQGDYLVTGEYLSYDPYGIVFRKGDSQLAALIDDSVFALAKDREIERRYTRWFLRKLPSGENLKLPMSPQLISIVEAMGAPTE